MDAFTFGKFCFFRGADLNEEEKILKEEMLKDDRENDFWAGWEIAGLIKKEKESAS